MTQPISQSLRAIAIASVSTLALTSLLIVPAYADVSETDVLNNYADIAEAGYQDSVAAARQVSEKIDQLIANPGDDTLSAARDAWRQARVPYMQTEVFRFGNTIVDDWEGKVNSWPLDEGLIDYVDEGFYGNASDANVFYAANVVANPRLTMSGGEIDASTIDRTLLTEQLHEADGNEANVATGYHAVEFLLWGQDTHGTEAGAGQRPATDFDTDNCSNGNCDRRIAYLKTVTSLLIDDLEWMAAQWDEEGAARATLLDNPQAGVSAMLTGMGSLSYGELAGERMQLGLMVHDPEEEQDCFSDNTHASHYYDAKGIQNVFNGEYTRIDGSTVSGPGIRDLLVADNPELAKELGARLAATMNTMQALVDSAANGQSYDQMIGDANPDGNARVQAAIDSLIGQTEYIDKAVTALNLDGIKFEGSDSLDAAEKVEG